MRYQPISKVKPGSTLAIPVISNNGSILLRRNTEITKFVLDRLIELGYTGLYILDDLSSDIIMNQNVPLSVRINAAQAVNNKNYDNCLALASEMTNSIITGDLEIKTNLEELGNYDSRTYLHSVNVATYAGIVGVLYGMTEDRIKNLIVTGLLHDIGKTMIDQDILNKPGKLNDEELAEMRKHPLYGYEMLKDNDSILSSVRVSIREHHEDYNGEGYPRKLAGDDIHIFARIVHICDVYDALVSKRSYKGEYNPAEVVEYITMHAGHMFDLELVKLFISNVQPFPNGIEVELSNGERAIIVKNNKTYPNRPIVRILSTGVDINLVDVLNITIIGVADYQ